jgi:hypothetical protein
VYRSAAFSHFSCRPPKRLNPPPAPDAALSAWQDVRAYQVGNGGVDCEPFAEGLEDLVPFLWVYDTICTLGKRFFMFVVKTRSF